MTATGSHSGGALVIHALEAQGVTRISCVPGESYLPVLDALISSPIKLDVARHEAGAGNMALAHGKLTGRAGVVAVTRGPGAMHAAIAVHTAEQDALPLVLLIGQVALRDRGRGGFQEMEYSRVFGSVAKWVTSLDTVERIPETIARAFRVAEGGRPGPVVIEMPEDILAATAVTDIVERRKPMLSAPSLTDIARVQQLLEKAQRPLLLLGRAPWSQKTADLAERFAKHFAMPALAGFRCQDFFNNTSSAYAGHVGLGTDARLAARLEEADLILSVGGHFGDAETQGYEILTPRSDRTVIHVAASEHDVDRYLHTDLALIATPSEFLATMLQLQEAATEQSAWMRALRAEEEARQTPPIQEGDPLSAIMGWLQDSLPEDAIVANGAGNYAVWVHQFTQYQRYGSQLAPASGAMGFGLPAGIAAGLARPEQEVIVFAGDGCFTMALPELATLASSDAKITVVIVNNGTYGTIRLHQERRYPGRVSGTSLSNPDFVALAQSFGLGASRVNTPEEFAIAYEAGRKSHTSTVIEVIVSADRSTPGVKLSDLAG